jgi:non-specific serine/threonine protein kinase
MTLEQAIEYALTVRPEEGVATGSETSPRSTVVKDRNALTPREGEIAVLIARGLSNRDIASHLSLAKRTVETHVQNILNKLNVNSRAAVAAWAVEHGFHSGR